MGVSPRGFFWFIFEFEVLELPLEVHAYARKDDESSSHRSERQLGIKGRIDVNSWSDEGCELNQGIRNRSIDERSGDAVVVNADSEIKTDVRIQRAAIGDRIRGSPHHWDYEVTGGAGSKKKSGFCACFKRCALKINGGFEFPKNSQVEFRANASDSEACARSPTL